GAGGAASERRGARLRRAGRERRLRPHLRGAGRVRAAARRPLVRRVRALRGRGLPRRGDQGRDRPLRLRLRRGGARDPARAARHRGALRLRRPHVRDDGAGAGALGRRQARPGPGVRELAQPLDGRHPAALQPEPPEGPHRRRRPPPARLRLHALPEGGQGHEGALTADNPPVPDPSIERFHRVVAVAYAHLSERRQEINDLNVFPVADGDTGDNMASTMAAVLEALEGLRTSALARIDRNLLVKTVEHAALMGARGNSGVILSQIVRGAAGELTTRRGDLIGPGLVRDATREAARAAYESVRDPQPGTMLTVIQEIADAVERRVAELGVEELAPGTTEAEQDAILADLLGTAVGAGQ